MKIRFLFLLLLITSYNSLKAQTLTDISDTAFYVGTPAARISIIGTSLNLDPSWGNVDMYLFNSTDTIRSFDNWGGISGGTGYAYGSFIFLEVNAGIYFIAFSDMNGVVMVFPNQITLNIAAVCNPAVFTSPVTVNDTTDRLRLKFEWNSDPDAVEYWVQFGMDSAVIPYDYYSKIIYTNSYEFKHALNDNSTYYMHVLALNAAGLATHWSTKKVTINASAPRLSAIVPNETYQGNNIFVPALSGINTHFIQASSTLDLSLEQEGYTIPATFPSIMEIENDERIIDGVFDILPTAPVGLYNVNLYDFIDGSMTMYNGVYIHEGYRYSGIMYYDLNSNGVYDSGDLVFPNMPLYDGFNKVFTDATGNFSTYRPNGSYTVAPYNYNLNCFTADPTDHTFTLNSSNTNQTGVDFALSAISGAHDVSVSINCTRPAVRIGSENTFKLIYSNIGPVPESGTITLSLPTGLSIDSASNPNFIINGNNVIWNYANLQVFSSDEFFVYLTASSSLVLGTPLLFEATIDNGTTDNDTTNNSMDVTLPLRNGFDPNYKIVSPEMVSAQDRLNGVELTYTIFFQNTGNDTAFQISVLDTIISNLDISTLSIVSSSHIMRPIIYPSRVVEFRFDNINLLDSNSNEPMSHGWVTFKIKSIPNLSPSDVILNTAFIYFDNNAPVKTNDCFLLNIGVDENDLLLNNLTVYPNPAKSSVKIIYPFNGTSKVVLMIFDASGKRIMSSEYPAQPKGEQILSLDVTTLAAGSYRIILSDGKNTKANTLIVR